MSDKPRQNISFPRRRSPLATISAPGPSATTRHFELHELLCAGAPFRLRDLAEKLGYSTRTLKRDIERLRDRHRAPIAWDARLKTYRYTAPFDLASGLRLGADEALAIVLAGRTFAAWGGTPLGRTLSAALEKIARFAGPAISFPAADLRAVLHHDPAAAPDDEHRHFAVLIEHILARRELTLTYQKPKSPRPERRRVRPLHLAYLDHRWVLVAEDPAKREWRKFLLARIHAIAVAPDRFTPPAKNKIRAYLAGSLGRFTGETDYTVRLRFDPTAAPYVRERPWHDSQKLSPLPDGSAEVTLRLNNLIDVKRRLLASGRHVEALEPAELRAALAAEIAALATTYAPEIAAEKILQKNSSGTADVPPHPLK